MAGLHDRMPVIVPPDSWATWLDPTLDDPAELHALFEPTDEVELRIWPVSQLVNNVRNDGPELFDEVAPLPALAAVAQPGLFDEAGGS
jgi:putative SOS response-associated peptidase YedK